MQLAHPIIRAPLDQPTLTPHTPLHSSTKSHCLTLHCMHTHHACPLTRGHYPHQSLHSTAQRTNPHRHLHSNSVCIRLSIHIYPSGTTHTDRHTDRCNYALKLLIHSPIHQLVHIQPIPRTLITITLHQHRTPSLTPCSIAYH